jgi:hypothetical protein
MDWNDLLRICRGRLGESTRTGKGDKRSYFDRYELILEASTIQNRASREIKCIETDTDGTAVQLVAGQVLHDLPQDCLMIRAAKYEDDHFLETQFSRRPHDTPMVSGQPSILFVQNNKIGFDTIVDANAILYMWYTKLTAIYGIKFEDQNTDSDTVTVTVTDKLLKIEISGGTKAGSYSFPFTAYPTIKTLVDAVNGSTINVYAARGQGCIPQRKCTDLELTVSRDWHQDDFAVFFPPELPEQMQEDIIVNAMMSAAEAKRGNIEKAEYYSKKCDAAIERNKQTWPDRMFGVGYPVIGDPDDSRFSMVDTRRVMRS